MMNRRITLTNVIGLCLLGSILSGCSTQSSMSKADEENFRHPKKLAPAEQAKALADYEAATRKAIAERQAAGLPAPSMPGGGMPGAPSSTPAQPSGN